MTRTALPLALALLSTGCATGGMVTGFSRPTSGHGELVIDPIDAEPVDMPVGTGPDGEEEAGVAPSAPACPTGAAPELHRRDRGRDRRADRQLRRLARGRHRRQDGAAGRADPARGPRHGPLTRPCPPLHTPIPPPRL